VKEKQTIGLPFENKVTGAGSGMGLTTARAFAQAGAALALADVHENAVRSGVEELVSPDIRRLPSVACR
jgi:NAD(P)-dependent dehydrogenase (short-subunit alcohol dehydrogenase family)